MRSRPLPTSRRRGGSNVRGRFLIIHNADAGSTLHRRLFYAVLDALEQRGAKLTLQIAGGIESDKALVAEAVRTGGYDAVIAAGGDGTIRGVGSGLLGSALPMGLLPVGTANVMAAEIGLTRRASDIAEQLLTGPARSVFCARANGEVFFLMAGAGFDGAVIRALNGGLKRWVGKLAYATPIMGTLAKPLPRLEVTVDGARHAARWAIVTNARHYAGSFVLSPASSVHEPELTTILFRPRSRLELLGQLLRIAGGTLPRSDRVTFLTSRRTEIRSDGEVPVEIDGEPLGTLPLTVEPDPRQVLVLVPSAERQREASAPDLRDAAE